MSMECLAGAAFGSRKDWERKRVPFCHFPGAWSAACVAGRPCLHFNYVSVPLCMHVCGNAAACSSCTYFAVVGI